MNARTLAVALWFFVAGAVGVAQEDNKPTIEPLQATVDLRVGQSAQVKLCDGKTATVKLLDLQETRDALRNAVRQARVTVEVNGEKVTLTSAFYRLPTVAGGVQIDCPVTKGVIGESSKKNVWALDADARLRLWPAGSPWIRPGTFVYPAKNRWFASDTQMANEPCFVDGGEVPGKTSIYYHYGLDIGGAEGLVEVVAATDGQIVSVAGKRLDDDSPASVVSPRYDVVYLRDGRGWYYRYSHLHTIDPGVKLGERVKMGQKIGLLGKEGGSGGWSHLHFDVSAMQPSGRYGIVEGYAFYWQAYVAQYKPKLQAVARPHHFVAVGKPVTLDATRSWSAAGPGHIARYEWMLSNGTNATGATLQRRYDRPGKYSEVLRVTDDRGRIDYDFCVVYVVDPAHTDRLPPSIHPVYWPTQGIKAGDEITLKVRSFRVAPQEGHEEWDFGDGSPTVKVQSDGNAQVHAADGYAVTKHRYTKPGHYLVRVRRTNNRGETATGHLHIRVGEGLP
ncbi:MAG: peptidoglycan DD-metalloendopeptidase family protein [Candidatus Nealsonbacteria bacterium]|nr:peptidoglycan DD-metalloendopeptidase family protein [Candidatus Nealsonbacteria bacterium]